MDKKVGFIGAGNMGGAMIRSIVKSGVVSASEIYVYDIDKSKLQTLQQETGITLLDTEEAVAEQSDIIILSVKPNAMKDLLKKVKPLMDSEKLVVSIAVGIPIQFYKNILGDDIKIIRTMPNTPSLVSAGMTLISYDENVLEEDILTIKSLFECFGLVEILDEHLMSEVTAVTGSSPAYVFMFIEAMADAAVKSGIPRKLAYKLSAQAVLGSAKMVLETGIHPGELKDQVCSPGGTTIEAVHTLEKNQFRYAIMEAMDECTKKAIEIGKRF